MAAISKAGRVARRVPRRARRGAKAARMAGRGVASASRRAGRMEGRREARRRNGRGRVTALAIGSGLGATAGYLLDPAEGKRRRHMLRDRTMATVRRGSRGTEKRARDMAGKAQGVMAEATPPGRDSSELNDPALEAKVETELFRPSDVPKGSVNVNVEDGVVYLRGEVSDRERIERMIADTQAIDGVSRIESLLHLPGEPAPDAAPIPRPSTSAK